MTKFKFKCKGVLDNGGSCDKYVYTKMHKGLSSIVEIQRLSDKINQLKVNNIDTTSEQEKLTELMSIPEVPTDWGFTLICSRGHEEDYTYGEREK